MRDAGFDELKLNGAHAAVVHIRRGDAVSAGGGVSHRYIADAIHTEGVVEGAIVAEDAAVAVRCVFAEADVGHEEKVGEVLA